MNIRRGSRAWITVDQIKDLRIFESKRDKGGVRALGDFDRRKVPKGPLDGQNLSRIILLFSGNRLLARSKPKKWNFMAPKSI